MYTDKIYHRIEDSRLFLQHYVPPILILKAVEGVDPIRRKTHRPQQNYGKKHHLEGGNTAPEGKSREDYGRLDAPIGVVHRGVTEYDAENKNDHGSGGVCDQQGKPKVIRQGAVSGYSSRYGNYVNERYRQKA